MDVPGMQCVAVCCSVLQCVAVCCSVLQCVAVCCSVLQCVAAMYASHEPCIQALDGGVRPPVDEFHMRHELHTYIWITRFHTHVCESRTLQASDVVERPPLCFRAHSFHTSHELHEEHVV